MDCNCRPASKVSGPPETTASLARGGSPLQARHQRRLQPPSGTLSPPTVVISDSFSEQWLQSENMEMPMFSPSEGPQQSAPTAVTLAAATPAAEAEAVTGTRVFPAVSSKGVAEGPASSTGAALATGGEGARFCRWNSGIDRGPGNRRYCSLRCISWGGTRVFSSSSGIGRTGGTGDQR